MLMLFAEVLSSTEPSFSYSPHRSKRYFLAEVCAYFAEKNSLLTNGVRCWHLYNKRYWLSRTKLASVEKHTHCVPDVRCVNDISTVEAARALPRRSVSPSGSTLRMFNVTKSDALVVQCNASNDHGYVFANAYLSVRGEFLYSTDLVRWIYTLSFIWLSVALLGKCQQLRQSRFAYRNLKVYPRLLSSSLCLQVIKI